MKTTEKDLSENTLTQKDFTTNMSIKNTSPLRSVRPQKSMVRIKSLKPKRLNIASKVMMKSGLK